MLGMCIMSSHHMARLHHSQGMQALLESITGKPLVHHRDMCMTTEGRLFHATEMCICSRTLFFEDGLDLLTICYT